MKMNKVFCAVALFAVAFTAWAQDFPSRPITLIVPFPPGGVADLTGRPIAAAMEKVLNQPIAPVNRSGAGGKVGYAAAANSKADGYTMLIALSSVSIFPEVDKLFELKPAYEMDQLVPIALLSADPTILVVHPSLPVKTAKEFVALAKKNPNEIGFSSSGIYGTLHIAMEMVIYSAKIKLRHVPFAGGGPAINALLGGHVAALSSGPAAAIRHLRAGKLRALANWGDQRLAALPDLPTWKELGYKDVEFYIWAGLMVPAGTPPEAVKALRDAARKGAQDAGFKKTMAKLETPIRYLDAPDFQKFWDQDAKRLAVTVRRVGKVQK
ncbi:MAG TPA: tripartite tricarboxylate transporter substrate binding protein [Burkholderiales bacterium]|jgi:tripartite-type tricarboxylate transporter receptor subunit TctC|nr:tripartite tricarboxylate transporter substrate binding protein [Burkholderiales bacterium]